MSRGGGRGRGRGGFGGSSSGGGGGFGNASLPMGLSFSELQNLSREQTALYPPRTLPIFSEPSPDERRVAALQLGFAKRLGKSKYLVLDRLSGRNRDHLERYSDKYLPSLTSRPTLKRKDLHAPFFPNEIFEDYFSPSGGVNKKRRVGEGGKEKGKKKGTINLDALDERSDEGTPPPSDAESQRQSDEPEEEDYDVEEENDNDYAENHFDNGEGDDMDGLGDGGGGGGGDEGFGGFGGGGDYD